MSKGIEDHLTLRKNCNVCGAQANRLMSFPGLPLTDTYAFPGASYSIEAVDQGLMYCEICGHGQLEAQLNPKLLYNNSYNFRTSESSTAVKGTEFFLNTLEKVAPGRSFKCVLDVGCNDLYLLKKLESKCSIRIGVDPVWSGREHENADRSIEVLGTSFEALSSADFRQAPDLIVCRHTLEHISDPRRFLEDLVSISAPNAIFLFEFPNFESLIRRMRFDQIFNQHFQYFSESSTWHLVNSVGCKVELIQHNYHDWGAMAVAFSKSDVASPPPSVVFSQSEILGRYASFQQFMGNFGETLAHLEPREELVGYGAAQMLPVIAYHANTDFSCLTKLYDDDPKKNGIKYWNLPVTVSLPEQDIDLSDKSVVITAIDNYKPIIAKLLSGGTRPKHVLAPLIII